MSFPSIDGYKRFANVMYSDKYDVSRATKEYIKIINNISNPDGILRLNNKDYRALNTIKLYTTFYYKLKICDFSDLKISKPGSIVDFFNLADDIFWSYYNSLSLSDDYKGMFLSYLVRIVMKYGLVGFKDITSEHIKEDNSSVYCLKFEILSNELVAHYQIKKLGVPSLDEYMDFYVFYTQDKENARFARRTYANTMQLYDSKEELVDNKDVSSNIRLFIMLTIGKPIKNQIEFRIMFPDKIITYYKMADYEFWDFYQKNVNGSEKRKILFLSSIIRVLLHLGKTKTSELVHEDIKLIYSEALYYGSLKTESFIPIIEKLIIKYTGVAKPFLARKVTYSGINAFNSYGDKEYINRYGTQNINLVTLIDKYLELKYEHKGRDVKAPLSHIKTFFTWLTKYHSGVESINEVDYKIALSYKKEIVESNYSERTKSEKLIRISMFFLWLYESNIIREILDLRGLGRNNAKSKSRMFENREHFKKVLNEVFCYEPSNELEHIVKRLILIAASTGLRFNEVLWLGPDCLKSVTEGIGEVTLQIREKQGTQNKTTSVLPWGVEVISDLNNRFYNISNRTQFYHKKSNSYYYSLFELDGRLPSYYSIYKIIRYLFEKADLRDDQGNLVDYENIKFHAFRHQKFSDIFEVTNGSLIAVKLDSGHKNIGMAKKYTVQSEKKKQIEALKLIEEGKLVGKGADILKELFKANYEPLKYIDIVKKMHLSESQVKDMVLLNMKNLGFGYCFVNNCKLRATCEGCDFYFIPENDCNKLKQKYSNNYKLLRAKFDTLGERNFLNCDDELGIIEQVKYEEKWLIELGVSDDEIQKLREFDYEELVHE